MSENVLAPLQVQLDWLQNSGIQIPDGDDIGGVYAWIDEAAAKPSFIYPEITGYYATLCCHLAAHQPDAGWIDRARSACDWILRVAQEEGSGAILGRKYVDDPTGAESDIYAFEHRLTLFFDAVMVGYGLCSTFDATGDQRYLDAAIRVGDTCLELFESDGGQVRHAVYDLNKQAAVPSGPRWSAHFASFEMKGVMFLESLAKQSERPEYAAMAERMLVAALETQQESGRFPTDGSQAATHLHPHCYTLEGLLWLVSNRDRRELLPHIRRGIAWAFENCLLIENRIQQWSEQPDLVIRGVRTDTVSQVFRAYHLTKMLDIDASWSWEGQLEPLYEKLSSFGTDSGATIYGEDEYGKKLSHSNSWCHMFRVEMLVYRQLRESQMAVDLSKLIIT
ncbi:MAG: hypothetical protein HRU17_05085 [Polyangiaceae bacterium]|nr:hypothetical protein [Polyangiaceae bacterium]